MTKPDEKISRAEQKAVQLLKQFEGFRAKPYLCPGGYLTIGYGHRIFSDDWGPISQERAEQILEADVSRFSAALVRVLGDKIDGLSSNQIAALISFVFNIGISAFKKSTLLKKLFEGAPATEVADEMKRWVYASGKILPGLVERRRIEAELFLSDEKEKNEGEEKNEL